MEEESADTGIVTRRAVIRGGATLVAGTALAGCADRSETPKGTPTGGSEEPTPTTDTEPESTPEGGDGPYTVEMAPMGEVTFDSVPQSVFTILTHHADMALALGRGDDLTALFSPEYNNTLMGAFTARLDGVSIDWSGLYSSWNPSLEQLYELDSDVHLSDPALVSTFSSWDAADIETVRENVSPWFGNYYSKDHAAPPDPWAERYEYYPLWEIFHRVSQVFREQERYDALLAERDAMLATIEAGLPPEGERPTVAMGLPSTADDVMWVYDVNAAGFFSAHTRPMGAVDAFAAVETVGSGSQVDYEALVEADPDVILALGGLVYGMAKIRNAFEDSPVASEITAVQEGRVYGQGTRWQGPIMNLFQLEMAAKQLYPERFGEWPAYEKGPYPEIPVDEQLFDHQRVADVVNGDV